MESLINIQSELKAPKNQYNSFGKYKYRNCEDILEALKPLLKKYKCTLTITDEIHEVGGLVFVESTVNFHDGEHTAQVSAQAGINPDRKGMDIAQSFGSSSSYSRKYALNGLFLIDDTKELDSTKPPEEKKEPVKDKEWFNPNTPSWDKAVSKKASIDTVKLHYKISKENEVKYLKEIK